MNEYVTRVLNETRKKNANEPEFLQTVEEVLTSLEPVITAHPEYEENAILERMTEPERTVMFKVVWQDDQGRVCINRGYRVQFSSAIGPYKGGLRFHPSVNLSIMKCLGFEQTLKNSLTTLPIGGAKGGSDFDPHGRSDGEIMRFCQAFMTELQRHIGTYTDIPAGDIGVGGREIGYLFGQYKRIRGAYENGVLTGKGLTYGGSLLRPEASGYGALYYAQEVFRHEEDNVAGKTIICSGYGNVTWGVAKKAAELGAKVVTISGHNGYVYDAEGITAPEKLDYLLTMRQARNANVKMYAEKFGCPFYEGEKPWGVKGDVYMPCATQNEVGMKEAEQIASSGAKYYFEVSNMPTSNEAIEYLKQRMIVAPSKAVNAGGVAVSALEMSQNARRMRDTGEEVDRNLHIIMKSIHDASMYAAEKYGLGYDLVKGANIAGFEKVAQAMLEQGWY